MITIKSHNLKVAHSRLAISDKSDSQPYIEENLIMVWNGEIYNHNCTFGKESESKFILDLYKSGGEQALGKLDGEYSIVIIDTEANKIIIARDYFGTKPLFAFSHNNSFKISTIAQQVKFRGGSVGDPIAIKNNSITILSLLDGKAIKSSELIKYSEINTALSLIKAKFETNEKLLENWNTSLEKAVLKRIPLEQKYTCLLSSGHDSGILASVLSRNDIKCNFLILPRGENLNVLSQRIELLSNNGHSIQILDINDNLERVVKDFINNYADKFQFHTQDFKTVDVVRDDPASLGHLISAAWCRYNGIKVLLSGQGGDELYSGYGLFGIKNNQTNIYDLNEIFDSANYPWIHSLGFQSNMSRYLLKDELMSSLTSTESRYPLLDLDLLKSLLGLSSVHFESKYKGPIESYLASSSFPFDESRVKRGFNPLSRDRSDRFITHFKDFTINVDSIMLGELLSNLPIQRI